MVHAHDTLRLLVDHDQRAAGLSHHVPGELHGKDRPEDELGISKGHNQRRRVFLPVLDAVAR